MKYLLLITMMMFGTAQANDLVYGGGTNTNSNSASNSAAGAVSSSGSSSNQGQGQGQEQGQGQNQGQSNNSATNQGQGQTLNYAPTYNNSGKSEIDYSGSYTVRSAPTMMAPAIYSANPCIISHSVGVSIIGGGFSAGSATKDEDCIIQNSSMRLIQMNLPEIAFETMCSLEHVYIASKRTKTPCTKNPEFEDEAAATATRTGSSSDATGGGWNGMVSAK